IDDRAAIDKVERAAHFLDDAVAELNQHANPVQAPDYATAYAYAALVCVRRIVDACREFAAATSDTWDTGCVHASSHLDEREQRARGLPLHGRTFVSSEGE